MSTLPLFPPPSTWDPSGGTTDTRSISSAEDLGKIATVSTFRHPEGHRIALSEARIEVDVGSPAALRYAWDHLSQLQGGDAAHTPCGLLEDAPTFGRRAFMLDISRCKIPTREGFRQWLKILKGFRFNELQLYMEHSFSYTGHDTVWNGASPLSAEDVTWLQAEAADVGIELVANQNCFGHFERWLKHDAYRKYAEAPDGFMSPWGDFRSVGSVLKPDDDSFRLVTGLLDELLPLFNSNRVNIGCDETFELGQGASKDRCEVEGVGAVYASFLNRIMRYVEEAHGKTPEFWGDILKKYPAEINRISREAVALCWGYEADGPFAEECRAFAESGLRFAVCPGTSSWNSFAGRSDNMIGNLTAAAQAAFEWGAEGLVLTDWGDNGHLQQEPVSYPAMALCALLAWQGPDADRHTAWNWCDAVAFDGQSGDTACWLEAGRVSDLTGVNHGNSSMLFDWFRAPDHHRGIDVQQEALDQVHSKLQSLKTPATFSNEWDQTVRNLDLSLRVLEDFRHRTSHASPLLQEAAKAHADLWLKRNREGGLAESLERYSRHHTTT